MVQQTAVEWLIEQLVELDKELDGIRKSDDSTVVKLNPTRIYDQAKQMEKEQKKHWHFENPNKDGEYICRMDNGYIKMCHYVNGIWYDMWDTGIKGTVKEWMDIPYDNF